MALDSVPNHFGFPTDFKEQVRARTDLVELIGESVALSARGPQDYVGLCPFHDDHNPSFHVYPDRQSYRCWVCDEGGDCFSFVMKYDRVGFREALEMLAERAGLEMPQSVRRQSPEQKDHRARLYEIAAWAEALCHQFLLEDRSAEPAREYLRSRGFSVETWKAFRLGYHPQDWEWLLGRGRLKKYAATDLAAAGLARQRDDGSHYVDPLFVGRVLFPIRDLRGRPVAFGGRVLPQDDKRDGKKYLNSLETELFTKSRLLYAFDESRPAIREAKSVVVMEGYTDCITAHQHGVRNVVATLGTSLTDDHVRHLKRFAPRVVLVFDGDNAGQGAAEKAVGRFLAQDVDLRILTLPENQDPADFLTVHGAEAFNRLAARAEEAWAYKLNACVRRQGVDSIDARQRVLEEMMSTMAQSPTLAGSSREAALVRELATRLMTDERAVRQTLKETRSKKVSRPASRPRPGADGEPRRLVDASNPDDVVECELLEMIFAVPGIVGRLQQEVGPGALRNVHLGQLLQLCFDLAERGDDPSFDKVTAALEDAELKRLAARIDEHARRKNIARLLQDERPFTTNNGTRTTYADYVIGQIRLRCERHHHEPLKGRLTGLVPSPAPSPDGSTDTTGNTPLNSPPDKAEQLRLLRQVQGYHARRANS